MSKSIEVIMAAYNQLLNTKLVLDGYLRQTDRNFSICIADDGSDVGIKNLVMLYQELGLNIRHVWHEDMGYRRARILNKAIAGSSSDFIILTDNDCIPSKHFIADYRQALTDGLLLAGRRVDLKASITDELLENKLEAARLDSVKYLIYQGVLGGIKRAEVGIRPPGFVYRQVNQKARKVIGANMAMSRSALLAVNGFDMDFEGYGFEECDLERRLLQYGLKSQSVVGRCILYHLYHVEKKERAEASALYQRKCSENRMICSNGIVPQPEY